MLSQEELERLYDSLNINVETCEENGVMLTAVHMVGVTNMSSNNVFEYFSGYTPSAVEMVNNDACNIYWRTPESAAEAIIAMSHSIAYKSTSYQIDDSDWEDSKPRYSPVPLSFIKKGVPPNGIWRLGLRYRKDSDIFMRFATVNDKNISSRLSDRAAKLPRARMYKTTKRRAQKRYHALDHDDVGNDLTDIDEEFENSVKRPKNPWSSMSKNWGNQEGQITHKAPLQGRLGPRVNMNDYQQLLTETKNNLQVYLPKVPRMRMYADDEEEGQKSTSCHERDDGVDDLADLRHKLNKKHFFKEPLQITRCASPLSDDNESEYDLRDRFYSRQSQLNKMRLGEDTTIMCTINNTQEMIVDSENVVTTGCASDETKTSVDDQMMVDEEVPSGMMSYESHRSPMITDSLDGDDETDSDSISSSSRIGRSEMKGRLGTKNNASPSSSSRGKLRMDEVASSVRKFNQKDDGKFNGMADIQVKVDYELHSRQRNM